MIFGKHINKYYFKYAYMLIPGILALLLVDVLQLEIPEYYRMIVNGIHPGDAAGEAVFTLDMTFLVEEICLPMLLIVLAMVFCRFLWRVCLFGAGIKVETDLRSKMFNHSKHLSQQFYHENKVGNMMSYYTSDLETIQECFGDGVLMLFDALLLGTLAVIKMYRLDPIMTLLSLIPMVFLLIIGSLVGHYMEKKWDARQEAFAALSDFAQENFSGIAVIKAFVKEFRELWAFKKLNKDNEKANIEFARTSVLLHISVTLFVESVICVILGYGGYLVSLNNGFDAGHLVEFISYFNSIVWPVMAVSSLIEMTSRGKASLKRISELLDTPVDVKDKDGATPIDEVKGDIEFRNLTFRYPGADYDALSDVSFTIKAGENVGVIGKTGSGKTTIVDIILRIYNVPDRSVFVDGRDVNGITISSLRAGCAYVPQDNFLFSDTIENNIAFAVDDFDRAEVEKYAALSDVHGNISEFQESYDTILGERGVTVSGGQKQRISIARALMKRASILILDDSVSAVDTETERTIIQNLRETRRGKTTILIAHRVSTVEKMDKIIFIDDGRVLAVGSHEELLRSCPEYNKTVELQKLDEERRAE